MGKNDWLNSMLEFPILLIVGVNVFDQFIVILKDKTLF